MPDNDNKPTTEETLIHIKAVVIEILTAFTSLQGVIYEQTEQLEILTEKVITLSTAVEHFKPPVDKKAGGLPIFERPLFQAVMLIFSGMGLYFFSTIIGEAIVRLILQWA